MRRISRVLAAFLACLPLPALAWDAVGHRAITVLAIEGLPGDMPAWLQTPQAKAMIADQSVTPDRWRGVRAPQLTHLNNPDHYLDVEDLEPYGLTLETMSPLRHEFVKQMVLAKEKAGSNFKGKPVNPATDQAKTNEWPGFVAHASAEEYGKLISAFRVVRILEQLNDPARADQLQMAKQTAMHHMGIMAHFVGDTAQPLHTTTHHHGWVGSNPNNYTTDRGIHSFIDGGVIRKHNITAADVKPHCDFTMTVANPMNPWPEILEHIRRSFREVEPLYILEQQGAFERLEGKRFVEVRLADGASMLSALYESAWKASAPDADDVKSFQRFDNFERSGSASGG